MTKHIAHFFTLILAAAFSCILAVPLVFAVNAVVSVLLSLPFWSAWDSAAVAVLIVTALLLFYHKPKFFRK